MATPNWEAVSGRDKVYFIIVDARYDAPIIHLGATISPRVLYTFHVQPRLGYGVISDFSYKGMHPVGSSGCA